MSHYRIDHGEGSTIELRSGRWTWIPVRLLSMPGGETALLHLAFGDDAYPGDAMWTTLQSDMHTLLEDAVNRIAEEPHVRRVITPLGEYHLSPLAHDQRGRWVSVRPTRAAISPVQLPDEHRLGELTHDELVKLIDNRVLCK
jgi:hypothetical protein